MKKDTIPASAIPRSTLGMTGGDYEGRFGCCGCFGKLSNHSNPERANL
jgi:hypothetical protein